MLTMGVTASWAGGTSTTVVVGVAWIAGGAIVGCTRFTVVGKIGTATATSVPPIWSTTTIVLGVDVVMITSSCGVGRGAAGDGAGVGVGVGAGSGRMGC